MSKVVTGAIAALLILFAVAGAYWFGTQQALSNAASRAAGATQQNGKAGASSGTPSNITVEAARVTTESLPQTITAVGSLRSDESVTLRPEVAGRISAIAFQEGQRVVKGTKLVQLDPAVPQAEVEQARANVTLAKTKYTRAVELA